MWGLEALNQSRSLLDAIIIVVTDGKVEPDCKDDRNLIHKKYSKKWEKCTIKLVRDEMDRSSYELAPSKGPTIGEILFEDGSLLYKSDGSALRQGPWIERFIAYSKDVQKKYAQQQQEKLKKKEEEKNKPFADIDF